MSDGGKKQPWTVRLIRGSVSLFVAVVLLHLTLALAKEIWWVLVIIAIVTIAIAILRWWYRWRDRWDP